MTSKKKENVPTKVINDFAKKEKQIWDYINNMMAEKAKELQKEGNK